ncbi:OmpA family protein [Pseudodesulfovibrio sp.]|uniref:OmpA family protein n=1 Tax=Pseudodesulfovibrio sp. TaxID=2035812 RepID=UPI00261276E7|nr:OmpA family protein [Pseudodesulfovibrio sp.]MDD3311357.1 OmpA family protein [Pseudodesulfovibrio sp.]
MKLTSKTLLLTLAAMLTLSFALAAPASAKMVKKADNFIFFLDQSGSMAMKYNGNGDRKIDMALSTMKAMNQAIPALDYTAGMFLFAPFEAKAQPGAYNKAAMAKVIDGVATDFDIFNRKTPMGNGLMDLDPVLSGLSGKTALIIFTDGNSNIGADPVAQAKALYAKYGDKLCIHIVSYADVARGQMIIDQIRALSSCTVVADYASLAAAGAMDKYAKDVFYEEVADAPAPAPAPAPVAVPSISFNLHFGFDKYQLTDEMIPVLEEAKAILDEYPNASFEVAGHTDSTGAEAYNQGLSERRAASVHDWLAAHGIDAKRLESKGYGELAPKYDNATREGRKLNRRVDILNK